MTLRIYWYAVGEHVYLRVFINGVPAGNLVIRISEFNFFRERVNAEYKERPNR